MQTAAPPAPMRCLVDRKTLLQGLKKLAPAVRSRHGLPSLASVKITATDDGVTLWATNLELGVQVTIPTDVAGFGEVALPFRRFQKLIQVAPDAPLEIRATEDGYGARLLWADAEYLVHGIPADQAVQLPQLDNDAPTMQITPAALRHLLDHTAYTAAVDDTRPYLTAIQLNMVESRLRAVATDSVRIGVAWADVEQVSECFSELLIPRLTCVYIRQLLARAKENVEIRTSNHVLFARVDDTLVYSRLLEGQYPDILRLVPTAFPMTATLDRQSWLGVLRRQSVLPKDGGVKMELNPQGIYLSTSVPEIGSARERIQGAYAGELLTIGFNSNYLIECLAHLTSQQVTMEMSGPRNPVRIRPVGDDDIMHVVLPLITY